MEGGVSRKRRFLYLTAVLVAALLTVVLWPSARERSEAPAADKSGVREAKAEMAEEGARQLRRTHSRRYGYSHAADRRNGRPTAPKAAPTQPNPPYNAPSPPAERKPLVVELNSADSLDLVQLRNIGPVFARRIIRFRDRLGGFMSTEQLKEVYGMDSARYYSLLPQIAIDASAAAQIDINTATIDDLKRHPYLDYYQAKAIVRLREERGPYSKIDDLQTIPIIDKETYTKIAPYIKCSLPQKK